MLIPGDGPEDCWAIEAKHRRGAITRPMVERVLRSAQVVARARGLTFARLWIVAPCGIRQLERLERLGAESFDAALAGEL